MDDEIFYVGQKAFIEKDGEVLVIFDPKEGLDYPGGKIQEHEMNLVESLKREVREETSLEVEVREPFATWLNIFPESHRFAGKKVFLIAYKYKYISGEVKLSHEHDKFRWVTKENYNEVDNGTSFFEILKKYFS